MGKCGADDIIRRQSYRKIMSRRITSRSMSKRHIVCLTFDFDAISGFIARGQTSPSWISRGEFGPRAGAPRLLALLKKYGIKRARFMPRPTIETYPKTAT